MYELQLFTVPPHFCIIFQSLLHKSYKYISTMLNILIQVLIKTCNH